jgi:outer membrane protein OmpA-like peptidoglycan-associated protein
MKSFHLTPTLLAVALLATACSSTPTTTSMLDQARNDYLVAQSSPGVATYAPLELKQAGSALEQANAAASHNDSLEAIDKLAYVAKQKIALAQEVTKQKTAEADVGRAAKERDQMRLDQRTAEADRAKAIAQQSQMTAQIAKNEANNANANAQQANAAALAAQSEASDAKRKTQMAQNDTADAQRQAQEAQARSAQLETQLKDLAAKKTERGIIITLGDVLFGTDLARLTSDGMRTIQKLAMVLQQNPLRKVLVEGFTDSTGAAAHNQELSERRANAVRGALLEQGIASDRVAIRGYGESYPVAANETAANRQLNRRVEIVLSDDSGKTVAR